MTPGNDDGRLALNETAANTNDPKDKMTTKSIAELDRAWFATMERLAVADVTFAVFLVDPLHPAARARRQAQRRARRSTTLPIPAVPPPHPPGRRLGARPRKAPDEDIDGGGFWPRRSAGAGGGRTVLARGTTTPRRILGAEVGR